MVKKGLDRGRRQGVLRRVTINAQLTGHLLLTLCVGLSTGPSRDVRQSLRPRDVSMAKAVGDVMRREGDALQERLGDSADTKLVYASPGTMPVLLRYEVIGCGYSV